MDNTYKYKKGTIRANFLDCGFEIGKICTIEAIKSILTNGKTTKNSDLIKYLNELIIPTDIYISEFDKQKERFLTKKKAVSSIPKKKKEIMSNVELDANNEKIIITHPNDMTCLDNQITAKKRGRKRKTFIHKYYYNPNYVAFWEEICNGERVLIDCLDNVFTYDLENPKYLGRYTLEGKIDSSQPYIKPNNNITKNYTPNVGE